MDLVGRKGRIQWFYTGIAYQARVVDYVGETGLHKVCWLDDYQFSTLRLGRISAPAFNIFAFRPNNPAPPSALAGCRIILEPTRPEFLPTYAQNSDKQPGEPYDFHACVLCRAENSPPRTYYVYYVAYNMIVTADLGAVRFAIINKADEVIELRNPDAPKIELDPPLRVTPFSDYIQA